MVNKNRYSDRETIPTPLGSKQLHRITCLECGCSIIGTPTQISRALKIHVGTSKGSRYLMKRIFFECPMCGRDETECSSTSYQSESLNELHNTALFD